MTATTVIVNASLQLTTNTIIRQVMIAVVFCTTKAMLSLIRLFTLAVSVDNLAATAPLDNDSIYFSLINTINEEHDRNPIIRGRPNTTRVQ